MSQDSIHSMPLTDFPVLETTHVDSSNIQNDKEYWYIVTAIDDKQNEIARSNAVSAIPHCEEETNPYNCQLMLRYKVGNRVYWINDDSKGPMDTAPIIMHSRMFLVIRYVTQSIPGITIWWDGSERKVTIQTLDGGTIELWIGKPEAR